MDAIFGLQDVKPNGRKAVPPLRESIRVLQFAFAMSVQLKVNKKESLLGQLAVLIWVWVGISSTSENHASWMGERWWRHDAFTYMQAWLLDIEQTTTAMVDASSQCNRYFFSIRKPVSWLHFTVIVLVLLVVGWLVLFLAPTLGNVIILYAICAHLRIGFLSEL